MSMSPASHCAICHSQHPTYHSRNTSGWWNLLTRCKATTEHRRLLFSFFLKILIQCWIFQQNTFLGKCVKAGNEGLSVGSELGSRFHTSDRSSGSHFTWFPRKNYNKSGRHGAEKHKRRKKQSKSETTCTDNWCFLMYEWRHFICVQDLVKKKLYISLCFCVIWAQN